ncbi:hypothetical protein RCL1_003441 [Eukaryota sp. TZLM3-RCL]
MYPALITLLFLFFSVYCTTTTPLYWKISSSCSSSIALHCDTAISTDTVTYSIWISSAQSSTFDNSSPTSSDLRLTYEFYSLGEFPQVSYYFMDDPLHHDVLPLFSHSSSLWKFSIPRPFTQDMLVIDIEPIGITVLNRQTLSFRFLNSFAFDFSHMFSSDITPLSASFFPIVRVDPDTFQSVILLKSDPLLPTDLLVFSPCSFKISNFFTSQPMGFEIFDLNFVHTFFIFTTTAGIIVFDPTTQNFSNFEVPFIENFTPRQIRKSTGVSIHAHNYWLIVVIFDPLSPSPTFLLNTGDLNPEVITIPSNLIADPFSIVDVTVAFPSRSIVFLLSSSSSSHFTVRFSLVSRSFSVPISHSFSSSPLFISNNFGSLDLFILTRESLSYSPNMGISFSSVKFLDENLVVNFDGVVESLVSASISGSGYTLVLTSQGNLYLGTSGSLNFHKIFTTVDPAHAERSTVFSNLGDLFYIISGNQIYDLVEHSTGLVEIDPHHESQRLLQSDLITPCQYTSFKTELAPFFFLDVADFLTISSSFIPLSSVLSFSALIGDSSLVSLTQQRTTNLLSPGVSKVTVDLVLRESQSTVRTVDFAARQKVGVGDTIVQLSASESTLACGSVLASSRIIIGCPPFRQLGVDQNFHQIFDPSEAFKICPEYFPDGLKYKYKVNGKELTYDVYRYGCPIKIFHGTFGYLPKLNIYDYGKKVKNVDVDFVVKEINSRDDWLYSTSMRASDCNGVPYIPNNFDPSRYISCRDSTTPWPTPNTLLTVFNNNSSNSIIFSKQGQGGLFLFRISVISPHFSYCNLTTFVALDVFGAQLPAIWASVIVGGSVLFLIVFFMISFSIYKKYKLKLEV